MLSAQITLEVPFHDVDAMEIAWHGHYAKYFELARCELLRLMHYDYQDMRDSGYSWPVIDMRIQYVKPCLYGQKISVHCTLTEYENRLKIEYEIKNPLTGERLTKGYTCQVAVNIQTGEMCLVSPSVLADKLRAIGAI